LSTHPGVQVKSPLLKPAPARTPSSVSLGGHPLHPMLIHFPIAFLLGGFACDLAFWWTGDAFWARAAVWIIGAGFGLGTVAGIAGTLDFMLVKGVRRHVTSWSHFLTAVMLLSLAATNWWLRVDDPAADVLPWGLFLSAVSALSLVVAGILGGRLVYEHNIGLGEE
jgi:uncharacterized membrane protein